MQHLGLLGLRDNRVGLRRRTRGKGHLLSPEQNDWNVRALPFQFTGNQRRLGTIGVEVQHNRIHRFLPETIHSIVPAARADHPPPVFLEERTAKVQKYGVIPDAENCIAAQSIHQHLPLRR